MPRRSQDSKSERAPKRVKVLVGVLVVLAVVGGAAVKFLQTTRGAIFLADHGVESAMPRVQREIGATLKRSLSASGLRRQLRAKPNSNPAQWDLPCDESNDLLIINVALTEAARSIGATVRNSEQTDKGRTLHFQVGTRSRETHHLTVRRLSSHVLASQARSRTPKVAIVIDDLGYTDGGIARDMVELEIPVTVSILPKLRHSHEVLALAKKHDRCILLHLPMEAQQRYPEDLEPVTVDMSDEEIASLVRDYMASLPGVNGVNNHQGSRATADGRVMRAVCGELEGDQVFFLDSLTSPESVAYNAAVDAGLPAAINDEFIDDGTQSRDEVDARLRNLVETARKQGTAVGIGHPHPWTLEALRDFDDYLLTTEVELVPLCDLVKSEK